MNNAHSATYTRVRMVARMGESWKKSIKIMVKVYGFTLLFFIFMRKNTRNKCKKVYQNAKWCVETRNKVCQFVKSTHHLQLPYLIYRKKQ